ncbi:MAG: C4-dicarboxylate ABC transporter, partial [Selenomonas sp.]|nr:C4-dicarboxylate ABC transporter [Selenomonas sp.]
MAIAGGIIVVLAFVAIIKKYETRMVLFGTGLLMCIIGGVADNAITTFSKT